MKQRMITRIQSGKARPDDAFVAITYADHWFWIDDKDAQSKRSFALLLVFMSLTESDQKTGSPLFTL